MPTIKINNTEYDTDALPDSAKQQLEMLALTDTEIRRLQAQLAIAQTARNAYARALAEAVKPTVPASDTIKL
jgi:ABC-type sulfate/molybdate transport systems ATPase subunit